MDIDGVQIQALRSLARMRENHSERLLKQVRRMQRLMRWLSAVLALDCIVIILNTLVLSHIIVGAWSVARFTWLVVAFTVYVALITMAAARHSRRLHAEGRLIDQYAAVTFRSRTL